MTSHGDTTTGFLRENISRYKRLLERTGCRNPLPTLNLLARFYAWRDESPYTLIPKAIEANPALPLDLCKLLETLEAVYSLREEIKERIFKTLGSPDRATGVG